jgi:hypothetical protein
LLQRGNVETAAYADRCADIIHRGTRKSFFQIPDVYLALREGKASAAFGSLFLHGSEPSFSLHITVEKIRKDIYTELNIPQNITYLQVLSEKI